MKKHYLVSVSAYVPYPKTVEYRVIASSHGRAADMGFRRFKKEHKRKRFKDVSFRVQSLGTVPTGIEQPVATPAASGAFRDVFKTARAVA